MGTLPKSISKEQAKKIFTIEVTKKSVIFDGKELASIENIRTSDSLIVGSLFSWMEKMHQSMIRKTKAHEIMIQADKEIEFAVIKKVMATCNKAGFTDFSVLVI